jgi:AcrR family transcriptional regulator
MAQADPADIRRAPAPAASSSGTRGARTRRTIVMAATRRFAADGFDETTLVDVAADAGVSGPTVAFHFGSKSGLLVAVINAHYEGLMAQIDEVVSAPSSPAERLVAFARYWVRPWDNDLYGVFVAYGGWRMTDSESGVALRENNRRLTRVFERLVDDLKADGTLRTGVSTHLVRDAFFGTVEHVQRGQLHAKHPFDSDQIADEVLDLVLRGARATPTASAGERPSLAAIDRKLDLLLARLDTDPLPDSGAP